MFTLLLNGVPVGQYPTREEAEKDARIERYHSATSRHETFTVSEEVFERVGG
jgi:hypothetical protein